MGFAPFGEVVSGMSVVEAIHSGYGELPDQAQVLVRKRERERDGRPVRVDERRALVADQRGSRGALRRARRLDRRRARLGGDPDRDVGWHVL